MSIDRNRFERHGEQSVTVGCGETDARTTRVYAEADTAFH
jgi:hypothetical protein